MKWARLSKAVDIDGTTIEYGAPGTDLTIESRKRHIPHANGSGTWDHTTYFVIRNGEELKELYSLSDAKEYAEKLEAAVRAARQMEGIYYVRVWLNEGELKPGDDIMLVLVGGDIRPHVIDALQTLVGTIKNQCVIEQEIYGNA